MYWAVDRCLQGAIEVLKCARRVPWRCLTGTFKAFDTHESHNVISEKAHVIGLSRLHFGWNNEGL